MDLIVKIRDDDHLADELWEAGDRLVVAHFTAKWSAPCKKIAKRMKVMSQKYREAVFLKVDVEKCHESAGILDIHFTPTFVLYQDHDILEIVKGPDMTGLELYITVHYDEDDEFLS